VILRQLVMEECRLKAHNFWNLSRNTCIDPSWKFILYNMSVCLRSQDDKTSYFIFLVSIRHKFFIKITLICCDQSLVLWVKSDQFDVLFVISILRLTSCRSLTSWICTEVCSETWDVLAKTGNKSNWKFIIVYKWVDNKIGCEELVVVYILFIAKFLKGFEPAVTWKMTKIKVFL
jgi:hypothetical protein